MGTASDKRTVSELEAHVVHLDLQKERIDQSISELKGQRQNVADELNRAKQELAKRKRCPEEATVSAHALLRYVERVLEVDLALLESHILSPANRAAIEAGATKITVDGVALVVRDKVVVTVVEG